EAFPIRAAVIGGGRGRPILLRSHYEAAVLLRARFDTLLAHEAARRGATLVEGTAVQEIVRENGRVIGVRTSEGAIEADAVIDCSGANTRLSRASRPGRTLHTIMGWYEGVAGNGDAANAVELYFDPVVKPYYGWVFPESQDRVNIGICYAPSPDAPKARERFAAFVESRLGHRMSGAVLVEGLVGHPIATSYRPTALVRDGVLVAGEAGHLVDPATAEGIHHALASGLLAGRHLGSTLDQGITPSAAHLEPYTGQVRQRVGKRLLAGEVLLQTIKTPVFDLALQFGSLKPVQSLLTWALAGA
ncbi:MAG TPA: NAD(P)/FAD-dependent oxidoreductase, partial [Chloroflexota bacterium]|nr:NAD(P)/FAD-dependent oxidoreductase [Chloroflexota bacterium]